MQSASVLDLSSSSVAQTGMQSGLCSRLSVAGGMSSASSARLSSLGPAGIEAEPVPLGHLQRQSSDFRLCEEEDSSASAPGGGGLRLSLSIGGLARAKSGMLPMTPGGSSAASEVRSPVASKVAEKKAAFKFVM